MKTILSLSALLITLTLTAQSNTASWFYNNTSSGIQTFGATASGESSIAMGYETTASGGSSTAMGMLTEASGNASTAMGVETKASGVYSTAMGYDTEASGNYSTAMGFRTTPSGVTSTAMGEATTASGNYSTTMGYNTTASDYNSFVIGRYNLLGSIVTNNATQFSTENTAFVIGNGIDTDNKSDALTVLFDGTTNVAGSVTATSFIGDGSQLTNLSSSSPFSLNTTSGNGIQSNNNTASGFASTAMGWLTEASGDYSTTMGEFTTASGTVSTAMGEFTTASGDNSTAMGAATTASGDASTAMGYNTLASGNFSIAMGENTTASGDASTAMGFETTASGYYSTAMGNRTLASGDGSTAMGDRTTASGNFSTAMGVGITASDYGSLVVGRYNLLGSTVTNSATEFSTDNTAFVIGNGLYDDRSDALTVLFDGTTTIAGDLSINSDARLKANIISLGSTLAKLLKIDGKTYTMKKDEDKKQKIGLLAQDIEKVFPELVSESNGVKSVNYQGLVPVLINALKEQDSKMNEQEARIERLEKLLLNN